MADRSDLPDDPAAEAARERRRAARLRALLKDREQRLGELERRLAALEGSTTYRFGRIVASAARAPGKRGVRLPRELYRLWRDRNAPVRANGTGGRDTARFDEPVRAEDRLLVATPPAGEAVRGPIVAGVLGPGTADALAEHARVVPVSPHDGRVVLADADLDALVVDAAAGAPGGPWAYLGVPGQFDRDRALADLRRVARSRNLPVLLYRAPDVQVPPTLAVLDWDATVTSPSGLTAYDPDHQETPCDPPSTPGDRAPSSTAMSI
ncbi:hypothetical protein [Actinomadura atramentaria]|uniref:hypothetical protein n=1 Tax=Actinomadura atramentaria TaxID=1990 RepID=UPI00037F3B40|nr:hypothetical protein [Actinomadura atramentaria]